MKTITQSKLIESSNIPAKLVKAVVRQLGGWECFKESAADITNHGINSGFHGFITYTDTVSFATRNKTEILLLAKERANDFGMGVFDMIARFNCLEGTTADEVAEGIFDPRSEQSTNILNALSWYAGEEVAHAYQNLFE